MLGRFWRGGFPDAGAFWRGEFPDGGIGNKKRELLLEVLFCGATRKHYQACNLLCVSVIDV